MNTPGKSQSQNDSDAKSTSSQKKIFSPAEIEYFVKQKLFYDNQASQGLIKQSDIWEKVFRDYKRAGYNLTLDALRKRFAKLNANWRAHPDTAPYRHLFEEAKNLPKTAILGKLSTPDNSTLTDHSGEETPAKEKNITPKKKKPIVRAKSPEMGNSEPSSPSHVVIPYQHIVETPVEVNADLKQDSPAAPLTTEPLVEVVVTKPPVKRSRSVKKAVTEPVAPTDIAADAAGDASTEGAPIVKKKRTVRKPTPAPATAPDETTTDIVKTIASLTERIPNDSQNIISLLLAHLSRTNENRLELYKLQFENFKQEFEKMGQVLADESRQFHQDARESITQELEFIKKILKIE